MASLHCVLGNQCCWTRHNWTRLVLSFKRTTWQEISSHYHPPMKLREHNAFGHICPSESPPPAVLTFGRYWSTYCCCKREIHILMEGFLVFSRISNKTDRFELDLNSISYLPPLADLLPPCRLALQVSQCSLLLQSSHVCKNCNWKITEKYFWG